MLLFICGVPKILSDEGFLWILVRRPFYIRHAFAHDASYLSIDLFLFRVLAPSQIFLAPTAVGSPRVLCPQGPVWNWGRQVQGRMRSV